MIIRVHKNLPAREIYLFSPGAAVKPEDYNSGVNALDSLGLKVRPDPHCRSRNPDWVYLAGTDKQRANAIRAAITGGYGACMAVRGGYGSLRSGMLALKGLKIPVNPPAIIGFSDVTALHALLNRLGIITFHGPNLAGFDRTDKETRQKTADLLSGRAGHAALSIHGLRALSGNGIVTARLLGGNLSVWCSMLGTGLLPDTKGSVLLLEDVNEPAYRIDRMLLQLRLALHSNPPVAVVFGDISDDSDTDFVLREFAGHVGIPVLTNAPVGHGHSNHPLALNALYSLDISRGTLKILENVYGD